MHKFIAYSLLISLLVASSAFQVAAQTAGEREIDEIRQDVSRLYGPPAKKVSVRLRSGASVKGFVDSVGSETFIVANDDNGRTVEIRYADVAKISSAGKGLSKNQKTALLVGATVGTLVVLGIVFKKKRDPWYGSRCAIFC